MLLERKYERYRTRRQPNPGVVGNRDVLVTRSEREVSLYTNSSLQANLVGARVCWCPIALARTSHIAVAKGSERADRGQRLKSQAQKADKAAQVGNTSQALAVRTGNADRVDLISIVVALARYAEYQLEGSALQSQIDVSAAGGCKLTALSLEVFATCDRGVRDCGVCGSVYGKLCWQGSRAQENKVDCEDYRID